MSSSIISHKCREDYEYKGSNKSVIGNLCADMSDVPSNDYPRADDIQSIEENSYNYADNGNVSFSDKLAIEIINYI